MSPWLPVSAAQSRLQRFVNRSAQVALALLGFLPLGAIGLQCIASVWDAAAWEIFWHEALRSRLWLAAWGMTLWTGLASTLLAYGLCAWLVSHSFARPLWASSVRMLGPMLAVPHAAFAVGLVFLVSPSGWILRALSPWLTGFYQTPLWLTSQDPWGLGVIAVLLCKELPFLLWAVATQLQRDDASVRLLREMQAAQTMGYARRTAFFKVVWPQLAQRIRWPLFAVLAYGLTVVDVALIAGPSNPPTLSVLAWQLLQDSDTAQNTQGAIAGWMLAGTTAVAAAVWLALGSMPWMHARHVRGGRGGRGMHGSEASQGVAPARLHSVLTRGLVYFFLSIYLAVWAALLVGSVSGVWPFPALLPANWSLDAWQAVWGSSSTVGATLALALGSTVLAMLWSLAWLELAPSRWQHAARGMLYLPLLLPSVLWVVGLHQLALQLSLSASFTALLLAHSLAVLPYTMIVLSPAYQGFDVRYAMATASMGRSYAAFLLCVKWPLLRSALYAACAVGVAVSVAQYLPTLYVGEGRYTTVTTEAVNLASGGQRSLVAAYAWLQWFIPVVGFALAAWLGRPRHFKAAA